MFLTLKQQFTRLEKANELNDFYKQPHCFIEFYENDERICSCDNYPQFIRIIREIYTPDFVELVLNTAFDYHKATISYGGVLSKLETEIATEEYINTRYIG